MHVRGGSKIPYDRLVLSPGIDFRFDAVPGYSPEAAATMPHAYGGGEQFKLLKRQLDAVGDGGRDRHHRAAAALSLSAGAL